MTPADLRAARAPLASFMAMGVLWGAFAGMVPATKAMLGAGDAVWGLMFLCSSTGAMIAMRFAPLTGRRLGRLALPVGTAAMALAFALPGHLAAIAAFAPAMALIGMSSGTLDVLMNARVSAIEHARGRHLMSLHHAAFSFAYAASAACTGPAREAGYGPGAVLTVAALAALALALTTLERRGALAPPDPPGTGSLGLIPLVGGLITLIAFLAENSAEAWSALHIERTLHGAPGLGSYGPALLGLTMGIGRMSGQLLSSRLREAILLRTAALTAAAGALTAALAPSPAVGYLGFVILGLGVAVIAPVALALVGRRVPPESRTRAIATASIVGYMGFFVGPSVLGAISSVAGLRASFGAVTLILLAALPLIPVLTRQK